MSVAEHTFTSWGTWRMMVSSLVSAEWPGTCGCCPGTVLIDRGGIYGVFHVLEGKGDDVSRDDCLQQKAQLLIEIGKHLAEFEWSYNGRSRGRMVEEKS